MTVKLRYKPLVGEDRQGYRREFVRLAETMKQLDK